MYSWVCLRPKSNYNTLLTISYACIVALPTPPQIYVGARLAREFPHPITMGSHRTP